MGTAIAVADIQVTVGDQVFDCLRKLYPIDRNVAIGFAGNVEAGFLAVEWLSSIVKSHARPGEPVSNLEDAVDEFSALAKNNYSSLGRSTQTGGCALLVGGASLDERQMYGSCPFVAKLTAPEFDIEVIERGEWGSVGSGNGIAEYRAQLESVTGDKADSLLTMETSFAGGYATLMAISVVEAIAEMPRVRGISEHFHTCVLTAHGFRFGDSKRTIYDGGPPREIALPPVASSWTELQRLLASHTGHAPTVAFA